MNEKEKKELMKMIDEIAATQQKLNKLCDERKAANDKWSSEESALYTELYKLQDKKRVLERDVVDNQVLGASNPSSLS